MSEEKKENRGGARKGAGRKATGKQYHIMSVTGSKEELDAIRKKAQEAGKSISRYIIDLCLNS